jgi:hypothetical protein
MIYSVNQAIADGKEYCTYLTSAMIDNYGNGNKDEADQQAINSCLVRAMTKVLEFYKLNGSDTELTARQINDVIAVIYEYDYALLLDIDDFSVQVGSDTDALGGGGSVVVLKSGTILPTAQSYMWIVANDGDDTFQVPFDVSQVDTDSISLVLNDADPVFGDSYSISGTTLSWTGAYPLSAGWKFEIKWWGVTNEIPN